MKEYRKYLNLLLGSIASYLYISVGSTLTAFTPIRPSSFLFENCTREAAGNASAECKITNYLGINIYEALHYALAAVLVAVVFGVVQKLLKRIGFPYSFSLLAIGFFVGWILSMLWFSDGDYWVSWFLVVLWSIEIALFMIVYFLLAKHILTL